MPKSIAITLCLAAMLLTTAPVSAAEAPTRDEYVVELEQICKPDQMAIQRAMKGLRADIQAERLQVAAKKFGKASSIFDSTIREITLVSRPAADTAKLGKWFTYLNRQVSFMHEITAQLRLGHAIKAQRLTARFIHNGNLANNVVLAFGFNWCNFKFSRYG